MGNYFEARFRFVPFTSSAFSRRKDRYTASGPATKIKPLLGASRPLGGPKISRWLPVNQRRVSITEGGDFLLSKINGAHKLKKKSRSFFSCIVLTTIKLSDENYSITLLHHSKTAVLHLPIVACQCPVTCRFIVPFTSIGTDTSTMIVQATLLVLF
jgi:hypothetical protein